MNNGKQKREKEKKEMTSANDPTFLSVVSSPRKSLTDAKENQRNERPLTAVAREQHESTRFDPPCSGGNRII